MLNFIPTHHAVQRARERTGWCRHALGRMLGRVHAAGIEAGDCPGPLRDYLQAVSYSENAPVIRLYGFHVFLFKEGIQPDEMILITILHLPVGLRSLANRMRLRGLPLAA